MHDSVLERVTLRRSLGAKYLTTPAPSKEDYAEAWPTELIKKAPSAPAAKL